MLGFIWATCLTWLAIYLSPLVSVFYFISKYKWDYNDDPGSQTAWYVELSLDTCHAVLMVVWYTIIVIKLRMQVPSIVDSYGNIK